MCWVRPGHRFPQTDNLIQANVHKIKQIMRVEVGFKVRKSHLFDLLPSRACSGRPMCATLRLSCFVMPPWAFDPSVFTPLSGHILIPDGPVPLCHFECSFFDFLLAS